VTWALVVPVKRLATAKTRLTGKSPQRRQDLALAFALDTVTAALASPLVEQVLVVTDDERAAEQLAALGVTIEPDLPEAGLNPALVHGAQVAAARHPGLGVGALSSDLPALRTRELDLALTAAAEHASTLVSDRGGLGTTLLTARTPGDFVPRFGPRSRAAHRQAGVVEPALGTAVTSLRSDVDTEVDLWEALRLGVGTHTTAVLASPH
jgi:2-phospho-L-lactate/phosphoenolpyruvate guanylyltransferase